MKRKLTMCDYVYGRCISVEEAENYISQWIATNLNPCSTCDTNKSKCNFYKILKSREQKSQVHKGVIP